MAIDRNIRARAFAYVRAYNAMHRRKGQHIGPFTRAFRDVLRAVLFLTDKRNNPSHRAIADEAHCSLDTVYRALTAFRGAGLLSWCNRYRWNERHRKVTRTLNEYRWLWPVMPCDERSKSENREVSLTSAESKKNGASPVDVGKNCASVPIDPLLEAALGAFMALRPR